MALLEYQNSIIPRFESYMLQFLEEYLSGHPDEIANMFYYHLGYQKNQIETFGSGKRLRPLLTLICTLGSGGLWENALPAAVAIELTHNFSLIHDDIEDKSDTRRGKLAVWKKWGIEQGINTGDAMQSVAVRAILELEKFYSPTVTVVCSKLLLDSIFLITSGQYLDLKYEGCERIDQNAYLQMIERKTATLIACSTKMGAILGGLDMNGQEYYFQFGKYLGLAFQIYDDWLGVWGISQKTGKPTASDLYQKKKSYPVVMGLSAAREFQDVWDKNIHLDEKHITQLISIMEENGIKDLVLKKAIAYSIESKKILEKMIINKTVKEGLIEMIDNLIKREK